MGGIIDRIFSRKLRTKLLQGHTGKEFYIRYDRDFDSFALMIVPPTTETVVHYINDPNVALLFEPKSREIVGIQVEAFQKSFLPRHSEVAKIWLQPKQHDQNFGDVINSVKEKRTQVVVEEVVRVTKPILDEEEPELSSMFRSSLSSSHAAFA